MKSTIISDIISINNEINLEYRTSTLPDFLKSFIAKRKRNKLKKQVEKIKNNNIIPVDIIANYIEQIYLKYSSYGHCYYIEPVVEGKSLYMATFKLKIKESVNDIIHMTVAPEEKDNSKFLVRYIYSVKGETKFAFSEQNVGFLENTKSYETEEYPYKNSIENIVVKDLICDAIINDIYLYLMDIILRSERIGEK